MLEESYVGLREAAASLPQQGTTSGTGGRQSLPKIADLLDKGLLKKGDALTIRGAQNSRAVIVDASQVDFNGEQVSYNKWGQQVKGWSSIRIYDWAVHETSGKTLGQIREELLEEAGSQSTVAELVDDNLSVGKANESQTSSQGAS